MQRAAGVALPVLVAATLVGCVRGRPAAAPNPSATPEPRSNATDARTFTATSFDTTWYITNRRREHRAATSELTRALTSPIADSLEYGFIVTRYRERAGPGSDGRFIEAVEAEQVDSARLSRGEFAARLAVHGVERRGTDATDSGRAPTNDDGAIIYVHGYAVSFSMGIAQGAEIAHRGAHRGPLVVFAWPAHRSIVTWPSPSAVVTRAYRDDSVAAAASHEAFRQAVDLVRQASGQRGLTIVGHSLGARLVAEALAAPSVLRDSLAAAPLPALVLFAADVSTARFRDTLATRLTTLAHRVVVYASDNDRMIAISRRLNGNERLGAAASAWAHVPAGVEVVDVTSGRLSRSALRKIFEPGHAMRFSSTALFDFYALVRGFPASCRGLAGTARHVAERVWQLTDAALPTTWPALDSCPSP